VSAVEPISEPDALRDDGQGPSRAEREALLRALLLARGLERALAMEGHRVPGRSALHDLPAAVSTVAALDPADPLFVPHDLLAAHITRGMPAADLLGARLGRSQRVRAGGRALAAIAPGVVVPLATGAALAIAQARPRQVAAAVVGADWLSDGATARAVELARDRGLPLAIVAIGSDDSPLRHMPRAVDRDDVEAVHDATATMVSRIRGGAGPAVLYCAPLATAGTASTSSLTPLRETGPDPLRRYEHWFSTHGFSREELAAVRSTVVTEVKQAWGDALPRSREVRAA
jgi:TPP-dependent pyruvate/acetoin dehydrogenase alpha subunit